MASGDFNGDGILDIAVTDSANNTVTVLLGNGSGLFISQGPMPTGLTPTAVAAADLNGDGKSDLVVANFSSTTLNVFLGWRRDLHICGICAGGLSQFWLWARRSCSWRF